jgi:lactate racemase
VHGIATYKNGVVKRREAKREPGIPREKCEQINLGYRHPNSINPEDCADRENQGILFLPNVGEMFTQLCEPPLWERAEL